MKKILEFILVISIIFVWLFYCVPVFATMTYGEIADYSVEVNIQPDTIIKVSEHIKHEFTSVDNRSWQRIIPLKNTKKQINKIKISNIEIKDGRGNEVNYKIDKNSQEYRISVIDEGESNNYYLLSYTVKNAFSNDAEVKKLNINWLGFFESNVVKQIKVNLKLPTEIDEKEIKAECLSGIEEMKNCVSNRYKYVGENKVSDIIFIDDKIRVGQKIGLNLQLPGNVFEEKKIFKKVISFIISYWLYLLVVVLVVSWSIYRKNKRIKI